MLWRTRKTRFRTWTPRRRCWMWDRTRGCSPWRHRSPRCPIRPRAWLRDDGLRFRASSGRPFRTWLATSQSGFSVFLPGCRPSRTRWQRPWSASRARLLLCRGARPVGPTVSGQFRRLWQRRVRLWRTDDALQSGLSRGVPCRTSLLAIHHCWRRCWDVCNPS